MNRLTLTLLASALALGPVRASGQEIEDPGLSALESLLTARVNTASKHEQRRSEAPAFVSIVTRREIREFGYRTLEEVLRNQVGFYSGNDREYADVGVRGFGRPGYYNNKILLLVDGHALNDNFSGGTRVGSAMSIDLDMVERIEIVRGPGSALYGARAMQAVVNLVTRTGRDLDGVEATAEVGANGAYGGSAQYGWVLGPRTDLTFATSWASQEGEDVYFPELDLTQLNGGLAEGLDWERRLRTLTTLRSGGLTLQAAFSQRSKGVPTAAYRTAFNHPDSDIHDRLGFLEARYERSVAPTADITVRGSFDSYDNDGTWPFGATDGSGQGQSIEHQVEVRSFGSEARLDWEPSPSQRVVFGVEAVRVPRARLTTSPENALTGGDFPYSILSAFVHQEFQFSEALALTLGLRRDEYSSIGSATTPRAALVFHAGADDATALKLLYGAAYRAPNLLELHVTSLSAALLGNPDLEPERIRTLEAVWEQRFSRLVTTVSLFQNEISDLIDLVEVELPPAEALIYGRLAFQQQNVANARARGIELEARAALGGSSQATLGYAFTQAEDTETGNRLVNSPRHQLKANASTSLRGWIDVGVTMRAEGRRRTLYGTETDPLALVDLTLTKPVSGHFTLQASAENVFDLQYSAPGGFQHVQSAIPQYGRRISVRLGYDW